MSERTSQRGSSATGTRAPERTVRRAAARAAAQQRITTARRRRTIATIGAVTVVVLGLAAGITFLVRATDSAGSSDALSKKPTVTAGTGDLTDLAVKTLVEGNGAKVKANQTLTVNYVGVSYKTGKEFDSSWSRSQPFTFTVGAGEVIEGWDRGLIGVRVGSRVQLDIPSSMAYGDTAAGGAPTGPLRFVVDVISAG